MSNDQLSWDKLFATNEGGSQEKTEKSGSAERSEKSDLPAVTVGGEGDAEKSSVANPSSEKSVLKRGTRKTSSEKSTRDAGSKTGLEASIELSKKNWGKLEMASSGAAAEATENSSVTASTSHELSRSTKTATRAAEAPTLAVMPEPQNILYYTVSETVSSGHDR